MPRGFDPRLISAARAEVCSVVGLKVANVPTTSGPPTVTHPTNSTGFVSRYRDAIRGGSHPIGAAVHAAKSVLPPGLDVAKTVGGTLAALNLVSSFGSIGGQVASTKDSIIDSYHDARRQS